MDKQTLYIILIIGIFNFLLINIFRLQKDIINIRNKVDGYIKPNNYKEVSKINENDTGIGLDGVKEKMNVIAELVPIDFNKIDESKEKFTPKYEQF